MKKKQFIGPFLDELLIWEKDLEDLNSLRKKKRVVGNKVE